MLSRFKLFFQAPTFDDPENNIQSQNINTILLTTLVLTFVYLIYSFFFPPLSQIFIAFAVLLIEVGLLIIIKNRHIQLASFLFSSFLWLAILIIEAYYGGIRDSGYSTFAAVIIIASLTMGVRTGVIFTALTILGGGILILAENLGLLPPYINVPLPSVLVSHSITFITVLLLLNLAVRGLISGARKVFEAEKVQEEINLQLENSRTDLEARSTILAQQNLALQTVADVAKLSTLAHSENEALNLVVQLLPEKLNLYHVGVFLLDETGEYAILRASNSEEGKLLIADKYQLRIARGEYAFMLSETGILNYQVGGQVYRITQPKSLENVQNNFSIPLTAGRRLQGLLNIQSTTALLQSTEWQEYLQTIANQIALTFENTRLLEQLQNQLREINTLARQTVKTGWEQVAKEGAFGYSYDRIQILPAGEQFPKEISSQMLAKESAYYVTSDKEPRARLVAPIILREETIGVIGYENDDPQHEWQPDEKGLLETIASRVSLALENARLVAESRQRANEEQMIGKVAARLRETLDIDTVLKTAVQEMRQSLDAERAEVRLIIGEDKTGPKK